VEPSAAAAVGQPAWPPPVELKTGRNRPPGPRRGGQAADAGARTPLCPGPRAAFRGRRPCVEGLLCVDGSGKKALWTFATRYSWRKLSVPQGPPPPPRRKLLVLPRELDGLPVAGGCKGLCTCQKARWGLSAMGVELLAMPPAAPPVPEASFKGRLAHGCRRSCAGGLKRHVTVDRLVLSHTVANGPAARAVAGHRSCKSPACACHAV